MTEPVITSFLDTDMYKLTMHAAVYKNFPTAEVTYKYTNRSEDMKFNQEAIQWLKFQFQSLSSLRFLEDEIEYLRNAIPYLSKDYLNYLASDEVKMNPSEQIEFNVLETNQEGHYDLEININGLWKDTILYEIPILALVSEAYFKFVDTDWSYDGQIESAFRKAEQLLEHNILFSEFGTRRRRSFKTQDLVMQGIMKATESRSERPSGLFLGTSNVLFAKKYGVKPIGTVAHEWMMGIASITGDYLHANQKAMDCWIGTFGPQNAGLALTDTFGTDDFLRSFHPPYSDCYIGVRQDSGDPVEYTKKISHHYLDVLKLKPLSKIICYSDSLNPEKAIRYANVAYDYGLKPTFGIGTNFTNDFKSKSNPERKSEPLNIVIKLLEVNGNHSIKISDNLGKNMGDPKTVEKVKEKLGYTEKSWIGDNEAHRWAS
ncbi:LAMI_0H06524g1_1 [Lachancea mirantina]|uniref:Nicotinate phosphoribosyltransferase n=1 Tax=Lachancea mirantina TaxID=1230905 RepID=A0A1G4KFG0_9SACH|nr:LAMI_0H06524g1_1 [Lachancea mirantina]